MNEEDKIECLTARWTARRSHPFNEYCIDQVLVLDTSQLPLGIKITNKKAWVTVQGDNLPRVKNVTIKYFGKWSEKSKYGIYFRVSSYQVMAPNSLSGLVTFLSSQSFQGITKLQAESIVNVFKSETLSVIKNNPERLLKVVNQDVADKLIKGINDNANGVALFDLLAKHGIGNNTIIKIKDYYGSEALSICKTNPFLLTNIGLQFSTCEKIAVGENIALDSYERIIGATQFKIRENESLTGNTYIGYEELKQKTLELLNKDKESVTNDRFEEMFKTACQNKDRIVCRLFAGNVRIVMQRQMDHDEFSVANKLSWLTENNVSEEEKILIDQEIANYTKNTSIKFDPTQVDAIKNSLYNRLSVITGGPGTGKTTIITAIIGVYEQVYKMPVTLMAPTGKAARRMTQATGRNATTIHSRLSISDVSSELNKPEPLKKGLIIIDESSMIDMALMNKICDAINNNQSHVIFVGDVDQLPSVGPGCVLAQMIESEKIPVTKLTKIFRQADGGKIVENAIKINFGNAENVEFNDKDFIFIKADTEEEAKEAIIAVYKNEVNEIGVDNVALLCPLRRTQGNKYLCTSDGLNPLLQDAINPSNNYNHSYHFSTGREIRINDRVLQWKNCKTSYNGDIGVIEDIVEDDRTAKFTIAWDNGNTVEVTKGEMSTIDLGYSMSIHKSQGSEYQTVIIPMLKDQEKCPLFKRNLVYTGVTRAKSKVIIIGNLNTFQKAVIANDSVKRKSLLKNRLILKKSK